MYSHSADTLDLEFVPHEQWVEFQLTAQQPPLFHPELAGKNPIGLRWYFGPFRFEEYVGDTEPDLAKSDPHRTAKARLVSWLRIHNTNKPSGWFQLSNKPARLEGIALATPAYWEAWSSTARRYRNKWLRDCAGKTYNITSISLDIFESEYRKSSAAKNGGDEMFEIAKRCPRVEYIVCKRIEDGAIRAGLAILNAPSVQSSYYFAGFYAEDSKHDPLMTGLIDYWFNTSFRNNLRVLHFGQFWQPGDPRSWKGFSAFKATFGIHFISYQPTLFRFAKGKLI